MRNVYVGLMTDTLVRWRLKSNACSLMKTSPQLTMVLFGKTCDLMVKD